MMLSVLLLLLLSSVSLQEADEASQQTTVNGAVEDVPVHRSMRLPARFKRQVSSLYSTYNNGNLKWKPITDPLPEGSVFINNDYAKRTDYIIKRGCGAGFYSPTPEPYCVPPTEPQCEFMRQMTVLVNEDDFEFLEWKDASSGSVPENSVRICPESEIYVGKNKYGIGEVDPKRRVFIVYLEGTEYQYSDYQVLTMNRDVKSNQVTDVDYKTDEAVILKDPPETMQVSVVKNAGCNSVVQTVTLTKEIQQERRWDISSSISLGVTTTMSAGLPGLVSGGLSISTAMSFTFSGGQTVTEGITHSVAVQITAPPNHICKAKMLGYKYKTDIPFTARLQRTYANEQTRTTTISGMYKGVQMGEVWAEVERCEPIPNAKACS